MDAAAANASAVLSNFVNAFMETIFLAPSGVLNASCRACDLRWEAKRSAAGKEGKRF